MSKRVKPILKVLLMLTIIFGIGYFDFAFADASTSQGIGVIATNVTTAFASLGKLMIATAYLAGFGFTIVSIFKFKQHKDNPTQIPIGTPLALLAIGVSLIFLPGLVAPIGQTLFGSSSSLKDIAGGFTGTGAAKIPGGEDATK